MYFFIPVTESIVCFRYMMQRQEKSTSFKPNPSTHMGGTKRSLYRDLEKQFLASRRISDTDAGSTISQENTDPVSYGVQSNQSDISSAENGTLESMSVKSGQVSVIRRAPSLNQTSDNSQSQKWSSCLAEISDNHQAVGSCETPDKLPRKQAEQEARYVSALALIQLAQGAS